MQEREGLNRRLAAAIERKFPEEGVAGLEGALRARSEERERQGRGKIPGSSKAMIYRYITTKAEPAVPPLEFLLEAADVLGTSFTWLATGRTLHEELFGPSPPPADEFEAMKEGIHETFPWGEDVPAWALQAPGQALVAYVDANPELQGSPAELVEVGREFGRRMGRVLAKGLEEYDVHPDALDPEELKIYVVGLTSVLSDLQLHRQYRMQRAARDLVERERAEREATTSGEG